jgi:Zn-dependent M28 family amino/carboxypeptidase
MGADIRGMVCLEMLGYFSDRIDGQSIPLPLLGKGISTTPNFIAIIGNEASQGLVAAVRKSIESGCRVPVESLVATRLIPGIDFSDHRSFWRAGYEAVMVTDTAFYRNPNYHTSSDTIETLDFEKMADLLKGLVEAAADLSNNKRGQ